MSILYINPGIPLLMDNCIGINNEEYTNTKYAVIPQKADEFITLLRQRTDNVYCKFDMRADLMNETWYGVKGFFKIKSQKHSLSLGMSPLMRVQLIMDDEELLFETEAIQQQIVSYELHVNVNKKTIQLFINNVLVYDYKGIINYFKEDSLEEYSLKNIINVEGDNINRLKGAVFSNIIIADHYVGKMQCCALLIEEDTDVELDKQINAVQIVSDDINNDSIEFIINGDNIDYGINNGIIKSDIMDLAPNNEFWNNHLLVRREVFSLEESSLEGSEET